MDTKTLFIRWDQVAHELDLIECESLPNLDRIDLAYETLEDFVHRYQGDTGADIRELPERILERLSEYITLKIEEHWDSTNLLQNLCKEEEISQLLPENLGIEGFEIHEDGIALHLDSNFVRSYNELIGAHALDGDYIMMLSDVTPQELLGFINTAGRQVQINTDNWETQCNTIRYQDLAKILEQEFAAEDQLNYFADSPNEIVPHRAWELDFLTLKEILFSGDVIARRPLLLDLFPEYIQQIPTDDKLHQAIYSEYHSGEESDLPRPMLKDKLLKKRHRNTVVDAHQKGIILPETVFKAYKIEDLEREPETITTGRKTAINTQLRTPRLRVAIGSLSGEPITIQRLSLTTGAILAKRLKGSDRPETLANRAAPLIKEMLAAGIDPIDIPHKAADYYAQ